MAAGAVAVLTILLTVVDIVRSCPRIAERRLTAASDIVFFADVDEREVESKNSIFYELPILVCPHQNDTPNSCYGIGSMLYKPYLRLDSTPK